MTLTGADPLVIGILYPPGVEASDLTRRLGSIRRPITVHVGSYNDDESVRIMKRRGEDSDRIRRLEPQLTPATIVTLSDAEVLLALDVPWDILRLSPRLRWIQAFGAGIRQFNETELWDHDVALTTAAGVGAEPIAEFVMGRLIQLFRRFRDLDTMQGEHRWERLQGSQSLIGKTMGIVGFGAIGKALARKAKAFDMRVIAIRRRYGPGVAASDADELMGPGGLNYLLASSDVVVLALPETADTRDLIGESELRLMKPTAILCNVARGSVLDEDALVEALRSRTIGAAILDVQREEPLPVTSPLWDIDNLFLSPHSAASIEGYFDRVLDLFARNVHLYVDGAPLLNVADKSAGY